MKISVFTAININLKKEEDKFITQQIGNLHEKLLG